jgi:hypothetical protein
MPRKIIIGLILSLSVLWALLGATMHLVYSETLPSAPDQSTGRTYRLVVNHGAVRYGTERDVRVQKVLEDGLFVAVFVSFATLLFGLGTGVLHFRGNTPASGFKNET